jgi:AcrR family transcriptional regulator
MAKKPKKLSREAILAEAKQLFSSKGYRGTTLADLTSVFDVSRPSIYYYFKSKVELLSELHEQGFDAASYRFDEVFQSDMPTREKFRKILELHATNLANDTDLIKILFMDIDEMPEKLAREIIQRRKKHTERIIEIYKTGVEEGVFKDIDPKMAVHLLMGACNWLTMWYSPKKSVKPEEIVDSLLEILSDGYQK